MTINKNLFKSKLVARGFNVTTFAQAIGVDRNTLYRRLRNDAEKLQVGDIKKMVQLLDLTAEDVIEIFFTEREQK